MDTLAQNITVGRERKWGINSSPLQQIVSGKYRVRMWAG